MELVLNRDDLKQKYREYPASSIDFDKLNKDAQEAMLIVGRGKFESGDTYNLIYAPKDERPVCTYTDYDPTRPNVVAVVVQTDANPHCVKEIYTLSEIVSRFISLTPNRFLLGIGEHAGTKLMSIDTFNSTYKPIKRW